ncbi:hypothetical protein QTP88_002700 [Uroleucon formosanum]
MTSQGVVERASAELSKRINGLTLRAANKPSPSTSSGGGTAAGTTGSPSRAPRTGTSVMERVTNVLCGGGTGGGGSGGLISGGSSSGGIQYPRFRGRTPVRNRVATYRIKRPVTWSEMMRDEQFLNGFFTCFSAAERVPLARVCVRWRDVLYRSPKFWYNVRPVIRCKQLRSYNYADKAAVFKSFVAREMTAITIYGAQDQDTVEFVNTYPFPNKNILALCLQSSSVTDRGLESFLDHLQGVWQLELVGCNEITEAGLWACLTPRIVSLTLSDCINVADDAVGAVAQMLPALNEFTLQAYHVTDAALGFFSSRQSNSLSALRLQSCWELTNHGIVNIVHSLPNLTVLSLSGCSKITDDGIELIAENLPKLQILDLSWCPRVTDAALEYIACDLVGLEQLVLDRCIHITDIGIGYISTMICLQALFLRWCSQLRNFSIQHLCGMRHLRILSLAGCHLLTSSGLSSLIQMRHLEELELTNCAGASPELLEYLHEHLPSCLIVR